MGRDAKKTAYRLGRWAEFLCAWRLRLCGYRIITRDYRQATGEIDLIARRGDILAFIEVKARDTVQNAAHALGPAQRRRIEKTALIFTSQHPEFNHCDCRFDLMMFSPKTWPQHIAGAWVLGE